MNTAQREKWLVNLAIAAVVLLFGDRFVLGPLVTTWKERKERIEQLDQQVIRGQALMDRESAIRRKWLEMWQTAIPRTKSVSENQVLQSVDRWAQESRIFWAIRNLISRGGKILDAAHPRWTLRQLNVS